MSMMTAVASSRAPGSISVGSKCTCKGCVVIGRRLTRGRRPGVSVNVPRRNPPRVRLAIQRECAGVFFIGESLTVRNEPKCCSQPFVPQCPRRFFRSLP